MKRLNLLLKPRWKIGCLVLILLPVLCWLSMFLYAKLAGQWAASRILPVPPDSKLVSQTLYTQYGYHNRLDLFLTSGSLVTVRDWFIEQHIPMNPIDGILEPNDTHYCSLPVSWGDDIYRLLFTAAFLTGAGRLSAYEVSPMCFSVCVYETPSAIESVYLVDVPTTLPPDSVAVTLNSCWPTW